MTGKPLKLGEILVAAEMISEDQLCAALRHQRNWGGRLGAALIKLGFITEEKLLASLAEQMRLPRVDLDGRSIDAELLNSLSAEKAREYHVIPVERREMHGTVYLLMAMTDPTNLVVIDDLQFITGCRVRPALATELSIQSAIDRHYGPVADPAERQPEPGSTEEKLQLLLQTLLRDGILSPKDYERIT